MQIHHGGVQELTPRHEVIHAEIQEREYVKVVGRTGTLEHEALSEAER